MRLLYLSAAVWLLNFGTVASYSRDFSTQGATYPGYSSSGRYAGTSYFPITTPTYQLTTTPSPTSQYYYSQPSQYSSNNNYYSNGQYSTIDRFHPNIRGQKQQHQLQQQQQQQQTFQAAGSQQVNTVVDPLIAQGSEVEPFQYAYDGGDHHEHHHDHHHEGEVMESSVDSPQVAAPPPDFTAHHHPVHPGYPSHPGYYYPSHQPGVDMVDLTTPPPGPDTSESKQAQQSFTYYFLGRKLWYIPLYFSIYFILYVGALVLKAIARHKILFPSDLQAAATASRSLKDTSDTRTLKLIHDANDKYFMKKR